MSEPTQEHRWAVRQSPIPSDAAVGVDLDPQGLDVVGAVGAASEVGEVELDLVPALVQTHGHRADEGLDTCRGLATFTPRSTFRGSAVDVNTRVSAYLIVGRAESPPHVLVVEDLDLESEVPDRVR